VEEKLAAWLEEKSIEYKLHTHKAVFTAAEAKIHCGHIPGLHCKNLFLKEKNKDNYFLVTIPADQRLDIKLLREKLDSAHLTFANEEDLEKYLGLTKGAVSPLGLVNDKRKKVIYILEEKVWSAERVTFHPNINTETLELSKDSFHRFVKEARNELIVLDL
jgi:Ala-tRNA(Pro) deacylase